jgi:hypothetical protein
MSGISQVLAEGSLHVGEDKDPVLKLKLSARRWERGLELLTRGEVSKATNFILNSATVSLYRTSSHPCYYSLFFSCVYSVNRSWSIDE